MLVCKLYSGKPFEDTENTNGTVPAVHSRVFRFVRYSAQNDATNAICARKGFGT